MQHLPKFQSKQYPCLPLTRCFKRELLVYSRVPQTRRSSPQERRIPNNSCFFCFSLNTRHWVTLPYLLPRANNSLVQCDRLVPQTGDRGESQGFGLDSRNPRAKRKLLQKLELPQHWERHLIYVTTRQRTSAEDKGAQSRADTENLQMSFP